MCSISGFSFRCQYFELTHNHEHFRDRWVQCHGSVTSDMMEKLKNWNELLYYWKIIDYWHKRDKCVSSSPQKCNREKKNKFFFRNFVVVINPHYVFSHSFDSFVLTVYGVVVPFFIRCKISGNKLNLQFAANWLHKKNRLQFS